MCCVCGNHRFGYTYMEEIYFQKLNSILLLYGGGG